MEEKKNESNDFNERPAFSADSIVTNDKRGGVLHKLLPKMAPAKTADMSYDEISAEMERIKQDFKIKQDRMERRMDQASDVIIKREVEKSLQEHVIKTRGDRTELAAVEFQDIIASPSEECSIAYFEEQTVVVPLDRVQEFLKIMHEFGVDIAALKPVNKHVVSRLKEIQWRAGKKPENLSVFDPWNSL